MERQVKEELLLGYDRKIIEMLDKLQSQLAIGNFLKFLIVGLLVAVMLSK